MFGEVDAGKDIASVAIFLFLLKTVINYWFAMTYKRKQNEIILSFADFQIMK